MPTPICLKNGCPEAKGHPEICLRCGFEEREHERRLRLPLTKGEDGLRRIYIHEKKDSEQAVPVLPELL